MRLSVRSERAEAEQPSYRVPQTNHEVLGTWRARLASPAVVFITSRLIVLAVLYLAPVLNPTYHRRSFFLDWDGNAYLYIARHGYPPLYPPGGGYLAHSAFFPLLPWLTRLLSYVTRTSLETSALVIVISVGFASAVAIWTLALDTLRDEQGATRAVMLAFLWPASFVLSMNYSDGLLILFASVCLLGLRRERWMLAGCAAALAGLSRPNGIALVLSCVCCAFSAIRRRRAFRALVAPLIAPLGMMGYFGFLWIRLHDPLLWFKAEKEGWHSGFDFGAQFAKNVFEAIHNPTARLDLVASSCAAFIGVGLVLWAIRCRLPSEQILYGVGVLVLAVGSGYGGGIPRYVLDAFPLFFAPAKCLGGPRPEVFVSAIALSVTGLVCFMLLVTVARGATP